MHGLLVISITVVTGDGVVQVLTPNACLIEVLVAGTMVVTLLVTTVSRQYVGVGSLEVVAVGNGAVSSNMPTMISVIHGTGRSY